MIVESEIKSVARFVGQFFAQCNPSGMSPLGFLHGLVGKICRSKERLGWHVCPSKVTFFVDEDGLAGLDFLEGKFSIPVLSLEQNLTHFDKNLGNPVLLHV